MGLHSILAAVQPSRAQAYLQHKVFVWLIITTGTVEWIGERSTASVVGGCFNMLLLLLLLLPPLVLPQQRCGRDGVLLLLVCYIGGGDVIINVSPWLCWCKIPFMWFSAGKKATMVASVYLLVLRNLHSASHQAVRNLQGRPASQVFCDQVLKEEELSGEKWRDEAWNEVGANKLQSSHSIITRRIRSTTFARRSQWCSWNRGPLGN